MIGDGAKACVLAHRDELTAQNRAKFQRVVPEASTSVIDATGEILERPGRLRHGADAGAGLEPGRHAAPRSAGDRRGASRGGGQLPPDHRPGARRQSRREGVRGDGNADPGRPQGSARGLRQCRRPGAAGRADRLGPPRAAAHLRHRRGRAGRIALGPQDHVGFRHDRGGGHHGPRAGHRRGDPALAREGRRPADGRLLLHRRPRRTM